MLSAVSTDLRSLADSLESVDVETVRTPPESLESTVGSLLVGTAVGVDPGRDDVTLPEPVTVDPTPAALEGATTGVTPAAFAVADYGSVVLPSNGTGSELVSLFVDRHVAILDRDDVVPDMEAAFERFGEHLPDSYNDAIVATGPSATADMGTLVKGAHGPSEVRVVVVEA